MILILKQLLQVVQDQREVQSVIFDVVTLPSSAKLAKEMAIQGKRYAEAVAVSGHGLRPPHLYVFGSVLKWTENEEAYTKYKAMSLPRRADIIKLCKCSKLYDQSQRKMVLSFGTGPEGQECRNIVLPMIVAIEGAVHRLGKAPRGFMERELGEWLGHLMQ